MSKKTESIEVRISPELKSALAAISDGRGRTMSDTVRNLIEGEVAGRVSPPSYGEKAMLSAAYTRFIRASALAVPVLVLAFIYMMGAQSPGHASAEIRIFFAEVDADGDDRITQGEIEAFAAEDGWQAEPDCAEMSEPCTLVDFAAERLAVADADMSGTVSYPEFEAVLMRDRAEDFLDADLDGNGTLTVDEIVGAELYWLAQDPEALAEEGITLSAACVAQLEAEALPGIAATCNFEAEGRAELAQFDADRSGTVTLLEYLSH